jgi:hypothetical protein
MKFGAKNDPPASTVGVFFAPNFIQNLYTVLKKRLWESRSTPTLNRQLEQMNYGHKFYCAVTNVDCSGERLTRVPKSLGF